MVECDGISGALTLLFAVVFAEEPGPPLQEAPPQPPPEVSWPLINCESCNRRKKKEPQLCYDCALERDGRLGLVKVQPCHWKDSLTLEVAQQLNGQGAAINPST